MPTSCLAHPQKPVRPVLRRVVLWFPDRGTHATGVGARPHNAVVGSSRRLQLPYTEVADRWVLHRVQPRGDTIVVVSRRAMPRRAGGARSYNTGAS